MKSIQAFFESVKTWEFRYLAFIAAVFFTTGFLSGWFNRGWFTKMDLPPVKEIRLGGYEFINPLLECEPARDPIGKELAPFQYKVQELIDDVKKRDWATHVSVYFREMNNGLAFSIEGQEKFTPASLLKVPLLIAYLKGSESNPSLLKATVKFDGLPDMNAAQTIKPALPMERGKAYSVEDLLFRAIAYSDNNAYFLLYANMNSTILHRVYSDLGLEVPKVRNREDYMSVVEYASFFRMLYNASYLNKETSEKALAILSEVDFKQGLVAGVAPGTVVAHKFGEKMYGPSGEVKQMHDCGIVYYPRHPYLLCVMSRGRSFEYLDDTIREISSLVYSEVDRQHAGH